MESVLVVITLVSLAMTIALAVILARLLRDERRRSEARVAVLRDMADAATHQQDVAEPALPDIVSRRIEEKIEKKVERVHRVSQPAVIAAGRDADVSADDLELVHGSGDLFVHPEARSAWPRRLAVAVAIALIVTLTVTALRSRSHSSGAAGRVDSPTVAARSAGLLELLSLQQTQGTDALTITGLVQNPRDGAVLSKVRATALLFGPDGSFLASGGAPLDFTVLRPGDESPFVINVPVTAPVARYRVGFRSEDGSVIGHIDRRTAATMASGPEPAPKTPRGPS
jgi:hypothetical protein